MDIEKKLKEIEENEKIVNNIKSGTELTFDERKTIVNSIENDILAILHGSEITVKLIEEFDEEHYVCDIIKVWGPAKEEIEQTGLKEGVRIKLGKNVDLERHNDDGTITIVF